MPNRNIKLTLPRQEMANKQTKCNALCNLLVLEAEETTLNKKKFKNKLKFRKKHLC